MYNILRRGFVLNIQRETISFDISKKKKIRVCIQADFRVRHFRCVHAQFSVVVFLKKQDI